MSTGYSGVSQVTKELPFVFNVDQKAMGTHGKTEAIIVRVADLECPMCDRDATLTAALAQGQNSLGEMLKIWDDTGSWQSESD